MAHHIAVSPRSIGEKMYSVIPVTLPKVYIELVAAPSADISFCATVKYPKGGFLLSNPCKDKIPSNDPPGGKKAQTRAF
jgi:hypothetical protein